MLGIAIFFLILGSWLATVVAVKFGALDFLVVYVPYAIAAVVVCAIIAWLVVRNAPQPAARIVISKGEHFSPAMRQKIADHEKKHLDKAREFGADGEWEYDNDGASFYVTRGSDKLLPEQWAAIAWAPTRGKPRGGEHSWDNKWAERRLKAYPTGQERNEARKRAQRLAR